MKITLEKAYTHELWKYDTDKVNINNSALSAGRLGEKMTR